VDLGGELVNHPGQLRVGMQLQLARDEVVVGLGLLERGLSVLTDHHERRQKDRLERDDERQSWPWTLLKNEHPRGEDHGMQIHEPHRAGERGDRVCYPQLELCRPALSLGHQARVPRFVELGFSHVQGPLVAPFWLYATLMGSDPALQRDVTCAICGLRIHEVYVGVNETSRLGLNGG